MRLRSLTNHLLPALAAALAAGCSSKDTMNRENTVTAEPARADTASAMAVPNTQMQRVLDQLSALGGKPIETLSAAEARKQPTPTDAVKALLTKDGNPRHRIPRFRQSIAPSRVPPGRSRFESTRRNRAPVRSLSLSIITAAVG